MNCPICRKKLNNDFQYLEHLEKEHKNNNDCGCGKQTGGKIKIPKQNILKNNDISKKLKKTMENARKKIEKVEANVNTNAIAYGLKMDKKDFNEIPLPVREKVKSLLLENQYLRGVVAANEKQIKIMKRQVDKCIDNIGVHYTIKD